MRSEAQAGPGSGRKTRGALPTTDVSAFNEEQAQAEVMAILDELKDTIERAMAIVEAGPLFPNDRPIKVEIEPGMVVGDWYVAKIKNLK